MRVLTYVLVFISGTNSNLKYIHFLQGTNTYKVFLQIQDKIFCKLFFSKFNYIM